jgi:putative transposase
MKALKERGYDVSDRLRILKPEEYNAFTYNQSGYRIERLKDGKYLLHLSKIGKIEIRIRRKPIDIKQITVVRQAGKWFAIVVCNILRRIHCSIKYEKTIGIDVGITNYAYDSDGGHVGNPLFMNQDLKKIRRSNRTLSRRMYGSINYKKALRWYQRLHQRIANKRRNFLHNLSNQYSIRYNVIFLERLKINNMNKNRCLARHIMDSSWGMFKHMLMYKANRVVEVDPYNTSIECSKCGNKVPKTLAIRIHECDRCGTVLDRDHNSACTIENRGMKLIGLLLRKLPMQHGEVTPVETMSVVAEAGTSPLALAVGS